jgi:hypothetical protein
LNWKIRIGMPQMELSATGVPTSVIPTYGSAVTRAADVFTVPTTAAGANGAWYTAGIGTIMVNGTTNYMKSFDASGLLSLTDGTSSNAVNMFFGGSAYNPNNLQFERLVSGSNVGSCATSNYTLGSPMKEIMAFQTNDINGAIAGTLCVDKASTFPTFTTLNIGQGRLGTGENLDGWVNRIWYMPTRQPDYSLPDYTR